MSVHTKWTTSCSLRPVIRNVEKSTCSLSFEAAKNRASSCSPYSHGRVVILPGKCNSRVMFGLPWRLRNWAIMITL